jgi:hypothetical protein
MRFIFVLVGWPGFVHDMRVFTDAMTKYSDMFPHPPTGKILPMMQLKILLELVQTNKIVHIYREILPSGLGIPEPSGLSCTIQANKVLSSEASRRAEARR